MGEVSLTTIIKQQKVLQLQPSRHQNQPDCSGLKCPVRLIFYGIEACPAQLIRGLCQKKACPMHSLRYLHKKKPGVRTLGFFLWMKKETEICAHRSPRLNKVLHDFVDRLIAKQTCILHQLSTNWAEEMRFFNFVKDFWNQFNLSISLIRMVFRLK